MKQRTVALKHFLQMIRAAFELKEDYNELNHVSVVQKGAFLLVEIKDLIVTSFTENEKELEYFFQGLVQVKVENCTFNQQVSLKGMCKLDIVNSDFRHPLDLSFSINELEPSLEIRNSSINALGFSEVARLYSGIIVDTKFQDLNFLGVTAGKGGIFLEKIDVAGELNLAFEETPPVIHCDWEMREQIHYAAPTVPLVMTKKKE